MSFVLRKKYTIHTSYSIKNIEIYIYIHSNKIALEANKFEEKIYIFSVLNICKPNV